MPSELHEQLARAAQREEMSLNRFVTDVLATSVGAHSESERQLASARAGACLPSPSPRLSPSAVRVALATNLVVVVVAGLCCRDPARARASARHLTRLQVRVRRRGSALAGTKRRACTTPRFTRRSRRSPPTRPGSCRRRPHAGPRSRSRSSRSRGAQGVAVLLPAADRRVHPRAARAAGAPADLRAGGPRAGRAGRRRRVPAPARRAADPGRRPRARRRRAARRSCRSVFAERSEFGFDPARFEAAYAELERALYEGRCVATVIAPLLGIALEHSTQRARARRRAVADARRRARRRARRGGLGRRRGAQRAGGPDRRPGAQRALAGVGCARAVPPDRSPRCACSSAAATRSARSAWTRTDAGRLADGAARARAAGRGS